MKIIWNTQVNAPCCPGEIVPANDSAGEAILIQSDWDFPGVASTFGWSCIRVQKEGIEKPCDHNSTDGTIDCAECGVKATDFITAAGQWLDENDGAEAEDPGYFNS